jgi:methionyl-tRNA synthetase
LGVSALLYSRETAWVKLYTNTHREFISSNNNELLKNVGNFVNRVLKFCEAKLDSTIPEHDTKTTIPEFVEHIKETNKHLTEYNSHMKGIKLRAGLSTILQ